MSDRGQGRSPTQTVWLALVVVYIAWGSTYVGIRYMDQTVPPLIGAAIRYLSAGIAMYGFLSVRHRRLPRVSLVQLGSVSLAAVLLLVGGNGFVCLAERHVPAGLAALVVSSVPLWLVVIRALTGDRPLRATVAGVCVGFLGVAVLVLRGGASQGVSVPDLLMVVGASVSWAIGSWATGRLKLPDDRAAATALEMLIGGAVMAGLGPALGEHWSAVADHASARSLLAIVYLASIGSVLAFTAYIWLLQHAPISQVSTYAYVNPVVAVLLGALLLSERITLTTVLGGAVIVVAVALVIRAEAGSRSAAAGSRVAVGSDGPD